MKNLFQQRVLTALAAPLLLGSCSRVLERSSQIVMNVGATLRQDAKGYANIYDVSVDEAVRQLKLQPALGGLGAELARRHPDTYAGSWIQHQPKYGFIVNVTGGVKEVSAYLRGTPLADLIEVRKVARSLKQLEAAQREAGDVIGDLNLPFESDINVFKNQAELYVIDKEQLCKALEANPDLRIPGGVVVIETGGFSSPQ